MTVLLESNGALYTGSGYFEFYQAQTFSFWFKKTASAANSTLAILEDTNSDSRLQLLVNASGDLQISIDIEGLNWDVSAGATVSNDEWHALVWDVDPNAGTSTLFVDGVQVDSCSAPDFFDWAFSSAFPEYAAVGGKFGSEYFDGKIDSFFYYGAHSPSQTRNQWEQRKPVAHTGILQNWLPLNADTVGTNWGFGEGDWQVDGTVVLEADTAPIPWGAGGDEVEHVYPTHTIELTPAVGVVRSQSLDLATEDRVALVPATAVLSAPDIDVESEDVISLTPAVADLVIPIMHADTEFVQLTPATASLVLPAIRVTSTNTLYDRIQCALIHKIKTFAFYRVKFDPNTGCASTDFGTQIQPIGILCNEVASNFDTARLNRRTFRDERQQWMWRAIVTFAEQAHMQQLEDDLCENILRIKKNTTLKQPSVAMRLVNTFYEHPVEQDGSQGSRVIFTFRADVAPV